MQIAYIQKGSVLTDSYLMEPQVQIGLNIKAIRKELGLSREKLAIRAGMSAAGIINIEKGERMPKSATLEAFARAFGMAWEDVVNYHRKDKNIPLPRLTDEEIVRQVAAKFGVSMG